MEWLFTNANDIIAVLTSLVTSASLIANFTKTDSDNKAVAKVGKIVNFVALNFKR